jgi:hypothetical protein
MIPTMNISNLPAPIEASINNPDKFAEAVTLMHTCPTASNTDIRYRVSVSNDAIGEYREIYEKQIQPQILTGFSLSETKLLARIARTTAYPLTPAAQREIDSLYFTLAHKRRQDGARRGAMWEGRLHPNAIPNATPIDEFTIGVAMRNNLEGMPQIKYWCDCLTSGTLCYVTHDADLIEPRLAETIDLDNYQDCQVTLRKGIRWSNGEKITAEQVAKCLANNVGKLGTVSTDRDRYIRVRLNRPSRTILNRIAYAPIAFRNRYVTSGAYTSKPHKPYRDKSIRFHANPHFCEPIHIPKVRLTFIENEVKAIERLDRRRIDFLTRSFLTDGKQSSRYVPQVFPDFLGVHFMLFFNRNRKTFKDPAACQAVIDALPKEAIKQHLKTGRIGNRKRKSPLLKSPINFHIVADPSEVQGVGTIIANALGNTPVWLVEFVANPRCLSFKRRKQFLPLSGRRRPD